MNKNSKKMKGFPKRLLALMLCCFCLMATVPISAVASETGESQITEESTFEQQSESASESLLPLSSEPSESNEGIVDQQGISEDNGNPEDENESDEASESVSTREPTEISETLVPQPTQSTDAAEESPEVTDPTEESPEVTDPTEESPEVTDPTEESPEVTDPTEESPEVTDPTEESPEVTDPTEESPEVTDPTVNSSDATEPEQISPVDALFERLMAATTYEELDALMEAMTEDEYVLLGQFTPEQNAALTALVEKLSENPVEELPTQEEQEAYKKYLTSRTYPVYVTVIRGSIGFDGIPSEPAYYESTGYAFFQNITSNGGYTTSGSNAFNSTTEGVISDDIIKHADFIPSIISDDVYGLADPTGVATMAMLPGVDFDKLLQGVANTGNNTNFYDSDGERVDKSNITNYRVIPYVIKVQEASAGRGWHIDCILVKKGVILAYDLNLPEGIQISTPNEVAAPFAQTHVFQNGETSHTFDIREITNIRDDNTISVTLGNKSYEATFKGWNTEPDGSGTMYQPNGNITISKDTTLYAIWEFNPGLGRGDLLVRKTVVDADGNVVADDDTEFTFTLNLPNDDTEEHTYTKYNSSNVSIGGGSIADNGTFTLMNGQYVVIDDLFPKTDDAELTDDNEAHEGWATITETAADGYTTTWKSGTVDGNATTVTIQDALVTSVICENKSAPKTTTITLDKVVAGNMGDRNKNFTFTVNVDGENFGTYTLNHNTPIVTIENVPVGSIVTITESDNSGYVVSATVDDMPVEVINSTVTINSVIANGHAVVFTNNKDVIIDTGILLDTLPYILILGVVAVGAVLLIKKRRNCYDD